MFSPLALAGISAGTGMLQSGLEAWYNAPKRQIKRLQKAGIHKNAFYEMGNPGNIGTPDLGITQEGLASSFETAQNMEFAEELQPHYVDKAREEARSASATANQDELSYDIASYIDEINRRNPGDFIERDADGTPIATVAGQDLYERTEQAKVRGLEADATNKETQTEKLEAEIQNVLADNARIQALAEKTGYEAEEIRLGLQYIEENERLKQRLLEQAVALGDEEVNMQQVTKEMYEIINEIDNQYVRAGLAGFIEIIKAFGGSTGSKGTTISID